jgi:hypothetical protein
LSVTVTLTIVAEDERQLGRIVSAFGRALQAGDDVPGERVDLTTATEHEGTAVTDPAEWYRAHGREFVDGLKPAAREALAAIVREGPEVPMDLVRAATGRSGTGLAGTLASIGAACKRLGAPRPYQVDHKRGIYQIDPGIREALRPHLA